ncbi:hypothetical protein N657DRAFT_262809 [Parathielavia appendiculata]|uniref:Uncharacterized protein n=1 Tax=Parathielavia appendiculata TaxID=2587402 RepID=A0AAN6TRQ1_9PEZI|nr:hypothetical protein N657DRAFT_262809 [Parathielavia appendiculata]
MENVAFHKRLPVPLLSVRSPVVFGFLATPILQPISSATLQFLLSIYFSSQFSLQSLSPSHSALPRLHLQRSSHSATFFSALDLKPCGYRSYRPF